MKNAACFIMFGLLPLSVPADDITKIDTVVEKQEHILDKVKNDPLQGRKYGVELNLIGVLSIKEDYRYFSSTVSYFSHALNAEIALPFLYSSDNYGRYPFTGEDRRFTLYRLDAHYRHFLGETVNGFYISGFSRLARLRGRTGSECYFFCFDDGTTHPYATENKFGIGIGIGYRIFFQDRIYWGTSLSVGRYIIGKNHRFNDSTRDDEQAIVDIELLKLGYAF